MAMRDVVQHAKLRNVATRDVVQHAKLSDIKTAAKPRTATSSRWSSSRRPTRTPRTIERTLPNTPTRDRDVDRLLREWLAAAIVQEAPTPLEFSSRAARLDPCRVNPIHLSRAAHDRV